MGDVVAAVRYANLRPSVNPLTGDVVVDSFGYGLSGADERALEFALRFAETTGRRCVAITAGPAAAESVLRMALSCGADLAIRVAAEDDFSGAVTAKSLVHAWRLQGVEPDVVLCGDHSPDRGIGSTPAFLAAELAAAQALGLSELRWETDRITAERRLDGGRRERLEATFPVVCSVEPGGPALRRASLPATLSAQQDDIAVVPGLPADSRVTVVSSGPYRPRTQVVAGPAGPDPLARVRALVGAGQPRSAPRVVRPVDAAEAADELLSFLRSNGYVS
jgi:electron transfer flavoprotein beta subunit